MKSRKEIMKFTFLLSTISISYSCGINRDLKQTPKVKRELSPNPDQFNINGPKESKGEIQIYTLPISAESLGLSM